MNNPPTLDQNHTKFLDKFVGAYGTGPSRAFLRSYEADLLSQIPIEPPVLDLACGDGLVSALTYGRVLDSGCDLMMSQLKKAKQRGQYKTLALADVRELPYPASTFCTAISNSSIEHIPGVEEVIREVARVLKPGGLFVFTVPNPRFNDWFWENWLWVRLGRPAQGQKSIENFNQIREHHNIFDIEQWTQLMRASGFSSVTHTEYLPFNATFVFSVLESLWNQSVVLPSMGGRKAASGRRINLGGGFLLMLPKGLRYSLQTQFLSLFSHQKSLEQGSHLLVIGRK